MELDQLRFFVTVAEELHHGRVAVRTGLPVASIGDRLAAVEREVGAPLLRRGGRGLELTVVGEALLREGREALRAAGRAVRESRRVAGLERTVLRLGLLDGLPGWLPPAVADVVATQAPGCRLIAVGGTVAEQLRAIEQEGADLAVIRCPVTPPRGARLLRIGEEELGVLMAAGDPLAAGGAVDPVALAGRELVWFPGESAPRAHVELLARLRAHPGAVSIGSASSAAPPDLIWLPLLDGGVHAVFGALWRPDTPNPAVHALVGGLSATLLRPPAGPHRDCDLELPAY